MFGNVCRGESCGEERLALACVAPALELLAHVLARHDVLDIKD